MAHSLRHRRLGAPTTIAAVSQLAPPMVDLFLIGAEQYHEILEEIPDVWECQRDDVAGTSCIGELQRGDHVIIGRQVSQETNSGVTRGPEPSRHHHRTDKMTPTRCSIGVPGGGRR
jgi:hypothetical protein